MNKHYFLFTSCGILLLAQTVAFDGIVSVPGDTRLADAAYISCTYVSLPSGEVSNFSIWQPPVIPANSDDYYFVISHAGDMTQGSAFHSLLSVSVNKSLILTGTFSMKIVNMQCPGEVKYGCDFSYKLQGRELRAYLRIVVKVPRRDNTNVPNAPASPFLVIAAVIPIVLLFPQTVAFDGLVSVPGDTTLGGAAYISCTVSLPSGEVSEFSFQPPVPSANPDDYYFVISHAEDMTKGSAYNSLLSVSVSKSGTPSWTFSTKVVKLERPGELKYECDFSYKLQGRVLRGSLRFGVKVPRSNNTNALIALAIAFLVTVGGIAVALLFYLYSQSSNPLIRVINGPNGNNVDVMGLSGYAWPGQDLSSQSSNPLVRVINSPNGNNVDVMGLSGCAWPGQDLSSLSSNLVQIAEELDGNNVEAMGLSGCTWPEQDLSSQSSNPLVRVTNGPTGNIVEVMGLSGCAWPGQDLSSQSSNPLVRVTNGPTGNNVEVMGLSGSTWPGQDLSSQSSNPLVRVINGPNGNNVEVMGLSGSTWPGQDYTEEEEERDEEEGEERDEEALSEEWENDNENEA